MQTSRQTEFKITPAVKKEIVKIVDERIREAHVMREDFTELKGIVRELAEAQKRTESGLNGLSIEVKELAEAQKRTEAELKELAGEVKDLTIEIRKLAKGLGETRGEVGGLSRTMAYAFENEAYRMLPDILKRKYNIEIIEKLIRQEIIGKEINIFGKAKRDGRDVFVLGESKLRLSDRGERAEDIFEELEEKVKAVKGEYGDIEIAIVLITHYATKGFLKKAEQKGVIVVQSFEW